MSQVSAGIYFEDIFFVRLFSVAAIVSIRFVVLGETFGRQFLISVSGRTPRVFTRSFGEITISQCIIANEVR